MPSRRAALLVVIACNLLWAGSYVAGKAALDEVSFVTLNALRFGIAAVILAPVVWRGRALLPRDRGGRLRLLAIAGFGFCGNKALEFLGLSLTTATDTALLITSESLVTLLLAVLVLGERLQRRIGAALLLGGVGVYVLVEGGLVAPHLLHGGEGVGDGIVVASLALESLATVSGARLMRSGAPVVVTGAAVILSECIWAPAAIGYALHGGAPHLTAGGWAGVAYLAVVTTVIAYSGWFWGMQRLSAQDLTPLLLVQPLAGTLIAAVVRGERPGASTLAGGACVLAGVALVALRREPSPAEAELQAMAPEAP
ncbi:MAG TPA: DMT family transporter [Candidatus Dormibacteraeota bacterium]|nr:DMT family transporter [Candidatus Dormibacteraeota bacterium]